jgi:hypothetical protein
VNKKTIQGASATEYFLRDTNKPPHAYFSHSEQSVCAAKKSELQSKDHANGVEKEYVIVKRTVTYPDLAEFPVGADSVGNLGGTVKEEILK